VFITQEMGSFVTRGTRAQKKPGDKSRVYCTLVDPAGFGAAAEVRQDLSQICRPPFTLQRPCHGPVRRHISPSEPPISSSSSVDFAVLALFASASPVNYVRFQRDLACKGPRSLKLRAQLGSTQHHGSALSSVFQRSFLFLALCRICALCTYSSPGRRVFQPGQGWAVGRYDRMTASFHGDPQLLKQRRMPPADDLHVTRDRSSPFLR